MSVEAALQKKGFTKDDGDHSYFVYHSSEGKKTSIFTKTSFGSSHKDIADHLVSQMARQIKLRTSDFKDLVSCTLDKEGYEKKLVEGGYLTLEKKEESKP